MTRDLLKRKSKLEDIVVYFESLSDKLSYLEESIGILEEESGDLFLNELRKEIKDLKEELDLLEIRNLLSGEMDKNNAILTIHPGAGGTESQDWAQMLMRMYLRWAEKHKFTAQIVDLQTGDEAGIKSATLMVAGQYAYGYLKSEAGVHRLVRISPYDQEKEGIRPLPLCLFIPRLKRTLI